ncbi:glycosyltransferase [Roseomonas sp. NAR14]|uniref:Glycosyltransferase n=1 Tax=Roseomonas acroporae TaxID=2937791 RepID=A0A9X2BTX4_9PROT|nr:glycosyltransferase [Roseomonas acroporae]MCK8784782.1 glycosyltransferase [Roseomonas acroporae]
MIPHVVCVPARDEAAAMPGLLAALAGQEGVGPVRVVLLANGCTDGTAAAAREAARRHPVLALRVIEATLPAGQATVGRARGMAMEAGAGWLGAAGGGGEGLLLGTDADALPPPGWIAANLRAVAAGAEAVGGEIRLAGEEGLPGWLRERRALVARYWSAVRALSDRLDPLPHDPPPRHGDHTGASLAVTVAAYRDAGGVPPLATGEDNALVAALERNGARLRHAPDAWVAVSAREDGRAPGGMAAEMRRWRRIAETGEPHLLPGPEFWAGLFARRRALRDGFAGGAGSGPGGGPGSGLETAAAATGIDVAVLRAVARESVNAIAFVARATPLLPPADTAEAEIVAATAALERMATAALERMATDALEGMATTAPEGVATAAPEAATGPAERGTAVGPAGRAAAGSRAA